MFPNEHLNIIIGKNGMGKTNLLEAIYMLSGAKSFRRAKDSQLISFNKTGSVIAGTIEEQDSSSELQINIESEPIKTRRGIKNKKDCGRASNLAGEFCAVVFSPEHLSLIKGSKEERRLFVDNAICNIYPTYINELRRYNRALLQKNSLLKNFNMGGAEEVLQVLDTELSALCEKICERRNRYVEEMLVYAGQYYSEISRNREKLWFRYSTAAKTADEYLNIFKNNLKNDLIAGFSTTGIHRDDITITLSGEDAKAFASQGQQRSVVLCLKQAEAQQFFDITSRQPVLLFDDVLSELDESRQDYLLNNITNRQTFFSACDERFFKKTVGRIYSMKEGTIEDVV